MSLYKKICKVLFFLVAFSCNSTNYKNTLKRIDIAIIAPSTGGSKEIWHKVFYLTGKSCEMNCGSSPDQIYSNSIKKFKLFDKAVRSKNKVIWAFRGGYGLDKIMSYIVKEDYSNIAPKIIVGYSDITALHLYFAQEYGWRTISGCTLKEFVTHDKSQNTYEYVLNYLTGKTDCLQIKNIEPLNKEAKKFKTISGKITGGNISIIQTSIGTHWQIDSSEKILFLEDVNVSGYVLDRILSHFENVGVFNNVKAIIFGDLSGGSEKLNDVGKILNNFAKNINIPVFRSLSFGHGKTNLPIGYNFDGELKQEKSGKTFEIIMR